MQDESVFPLITLCLTCYNAEETIERAVRAALAQDYPVIEVLVLDDASTDSSAELLKVLAEQDSRIRLFQHLDNQGCSVARNTLLENARGDFVAFFDDDDVSRSDRLRLQLKSLLDYENENRAALVACYASGQRIYQNGYVQPILAVGSHKAPPIGEQMASYLLFNERLPGVFYGAGTPTCSLFTRTSTLRELGGFDPLLRRQEDVDFAVRLGLQGGHFIGIPDPVLTQYATQGSDKSARVEFESGLAILRKHKDFLLKRKSYNYMLLWLELRYSHFSSQRLRAFGVLLKLFVNYPIRTVKHFGRSALRRAVHEARMNR